MCGVFQNIDPPPPHRPPASVYPPPPPPPLVRWEDTLAGWRGGWGVNSSEDSRHCSALYICKYFVAEAQPSKKGGREYRLLYGGGEGNGRKWIKEMLPEIR
jgi:hypothetical protein